MAKLVLVAAKRRVMCDYWSRILTEANYQTATCWTTVDDVLRQVSESKPDLLLVEFDFDKGQGFETVRKTIMNHSALRCIMTMPVGITYQLQAIQTDISGYLPEDIDDPSEMLRCLNQIGQGYRYINEAFWDILHLPTDHYRQVISGLSPRRRQLLRLVAEGLTSRQIALDMGIAEATVRHHKEQITTLVGLKGVYELKIFAGAIAHLLR